MRLRLLFAVALVSPTGALTAQDTAAAIPALSARVTRIRFFEGARALPSLRDRQYATQFDSATARSIYTEIGLAYPPATQAVALTVECGYTAPAGAVTGTARVEVRADAGWELSVHAGGAGSDTPGSWAPGSYTVACRFANRVIATGRFEILRPPPPPAPPPPSRTPARTPNRAPPPPEPARDPEAKVPAMLSNVAFGPVKAKVTAVRIFESGGTVPERKDRIVGTTFDALTTRFINLELELQYPKVSKPAAFQIPCRFEGPDSTERATTLDVEVDPGWVGSYHTAGFGARNRGMWPEGNYRVTCLGDGKVVVASEFKVVKAKAAVEALGASLTHLRFFQSLGERLPVESRQYAARFDGRTARWIKTEFGLVYPQLAAPVSFTVECTYSFPDGTTRQSSVTRQAPAGWTGSVHAQGIGADHPGSWPAGVYRVSCGSGGREFAAERFEVTGVEPVATAGSTLRFLGRRQEALTPGGGFVLGAIDSVVVETSLSARSAGDSTALHCTLTDPAGIPSGFEIAGELRDRTITGRAALEAPRWRGTYRVECRAGGRATTAGRFDMTGPAELAGPDARLVSALLYEGAENAPDDEAVADVAFSAAKIRSFWMVALLDHPTDTPTTTFAYSCRISGARNAVLADTGPQAVPLAPGDRAIAIRQRLTLLPRQRWTAGKYTLTCTSSGTPFLRVGIDLTR